VRKKRRFALGSTQKKHFKVSKKNFGGSRTCYLLHSDASKNRVKKNPLRNYRLGDIVWVLLCTVGLAWTMVNAAEYPHLTVLS
jgi:hypothetical protein